MFCWRKRDTSMDVLRIPIASDLSNNARWPARLPPMPARRLLPPSLALLALAAQPGTPARPVRLLQTGGFSGLSDVQAVLPMFAKF